MHGLTGGSWKRHTDRTRATEMKDTRGNLAVTSGSETYRRCALPRQLSTLLPRRNRHKRPILAATTQGQQLDDALKAHLKNPVGRAADSLLFPTDVGRHMHSDNYRTHWEKARAAIGKPHLRVHDLRHVGAVLAAQSGATTAELMHRLGHTTPQMALRYQHVAEGRDAEIAQRLSKLAIGEGK